MNTSPDKKTINGFPFVSYNPEVLSPEKMRENSHAFYKKMNERRSTRYFSNKPIPMEIIENIIKTASSAPSGAHKQPWTFCVVQDAQLKKEIRKAAEKEEYDSYNGRMSEEWIKDLAPLGTDWHKEFLEEAPYLIIVFKQVYGLNGTREKQTHYYVNESVGIAFGFLIAAIHMAGLVTLTQTPSPMNFLSKILKRPENERPFLLLPVGYPKADNYVPDFSRKDLDQTTVFY